MSSCIVGKNAFLKNQRNLFFEQQLPHRSVGILTGYPMLLLRTNASNWSNRYPLLESKRICFPTISFILVNSEKKFVVLILANYFESICLDDHDIDVLKPLPKQISDSLKKSCYLVIQVLIQNKV